MYTIDMTATGRQSDVNRLVNVILNDNFENRLAHIQMEGDADKTTLQLIADVASSTRDILFNHGIIPSPLIEYDMEGTIDAIDEYFGGAYHGDFRRHDGITSLDSIDWTLHDVTFTLPANVPFTDSEE